jgi:hypothetical protein
VQAFLEKYSRYVFPAVLIVSLIVFSCVLIAHEKWEYLGSLFFTSATATFAYQALIYTKEKFRLELFEKRMAIFEPVKNFCDAIHDAVDIKVRRSDMLSELVLITSESGVLEFPASGVVEVMFLYEQIDEFKLAALFDSEVSGMGHAVYDAISNLEHTVKDADHEVDLIKYLKTCAWKWPTLFMPYIYFGDYKRDKIPD